VGRTWLIHRYLSSALADSAWGEGEKVKHETQCPKVYGENVVGSCICGERKPGNLRSDWGEPLPLDTKDVEDAEFDRELAAAVVEKAAKERSARRERIATAALVGILTRHYEVLSTAETRARDAVLAADALIAELDKEGK
jgi:hypothetical protein